MDIEPTSAPPVHSLRRSGRRPALHGKHSPPYVHGPREHRPDDGIGSAPSRFPGSGRARPRKGRTSRWELLAVFVLSLALAMTLFHEAWTNPLNTQLGGAGDADEYAWFLSWMPFALGHLHNPLVSHYVNFPNGVNLMWNTSVVLPSFLMSPFTVIFNANFSYNALETLGPALSATFGYMAFRRWTGRLPALAGALIFGFSPYMVSQAPGHLAQVLITSAPLFLIALDRLLVVQGSKPWVDGLLLGLLAWAQLLTGEEVLAMEVVAAAIAVAVLCVIARHQISSHLAYARRASVLAAGVFAVLSAPFLAFQYLGPYRVQNVHPANVYVSDLLNFITPTDMIKLAPVMATNVAIRFTGNGSEQGAYIGLPVVIFIVLTLLVARRRPVTWVALAVAVGAGVLSMGPTLHVGGHVTGFRLPDDLLQHMPFFHNLLPDRFASMMTLGVALLVALGLDELKHLWKPVLAMGWALVALGMAALFPITDFPAANSPMYSAFVTGFSCPKPKAGDAPVALVLPGINEMNLRWQAEANFCFAMPTDTGMTGTNSHFRKGLGVLFTIGDPGQPELPTSTALRVQAAQEIQQYHISEIVVDPEWPTSPVWTPQGQAEVVVWIEWLLGQAPQHSKDDYLSYVWKDLPPVADIASGRVGTVKGEA